MGFQDQQPGEIRATLAVSQEEALYGSSRAINLPGGRTTTVIVPAGTRDGYELRLPGQGSVSSEGGMPGDLILRVSVLTSGAAHRVNDDYATDRVSYPSSPNAGPSGYASSGNSPAWSGYAQPTQGSSFAAAPTDAVNNGFPGQPQVGQSQPYPGYGGYQSNPGYGQATPSVPQSYPGYGGYQSNPGYGQAMPPQGNPTGSPKPKRNGAVTALILVIALVLIVGSGLIYYLGYYQPNQAHTIATQTAQSQTIATANAAASGTAQVVQATAHAAATSTVQVQGTAQAYQSIYTKATSGTPALQDPLSSPTLNPLWDITVGGTTSGACAFTDGSYHSKIPTSGFFEPCYALNTNYTNFAFQVNMTITQGDFGGILLRANTAHSKFYLFRVGVDGSFALYNYATDQGSQAALLLTGSTRSINGLNQKNEVTVVAQRTTMYFYLNRQYLGSSNDNAYSAGQIGVFAESAKNPTDVAFSNAKVWTL